MEQAARAEICELRARLLEAHQELAEVGTAKAVSGCTEKLVARQACEVEMQQSQQDILAARAEVTMHFETRLRHSLRFGQPAELVRRLLRARVEWLQLHCLLVWRAVT